MNETVTIPATSNFKMLRAMVGIGALCGLLIVLTYEGTLPRVERLRAEALEKAIFKVIPGITETRAFSYNGEVFVPASEDASQIIYAGYDEEGVFKGVAIEASGQGYADIIRILYGYSPENQTIIGFYVLESKETPGLGDKIEKDQNFLTNFKALDVSLTVDYKELRNTVVPVKYGTKENPWEVDGITGATISSRAIGNIIGSSSQLWVPVVYKNMEAFNIQNNE